MVWFTKFYFLFGLLICILYDCSCEKLAEKKNSGATYKNEHYKSEPQKGSNFCFSRVTYGGIDGAYYTSTRTRKIGADGVCDVIWCVQLFFKVIFFILMLSIWVNPGGNGG